MALSKNNNGVSQLQLCVILSLTLLGLSACGVMKPQPLTLVPVPDSSLSQVKDSKFDRFVLSQPGALKGYRKVILFPMQFDRLQLEQAADKELIASWNASNWKEMDDICQQFDDLLSKTFRAGKTLQPTQQGGTDVLAIEFRLMRFMPYTKRYKDASLATVGSSTNTGGIGEISVQAVLANAKTGALVGVIEDAMRVDSNAYMAGNISAQLDSNSKVAQNLAWRAVFKYWAGSLHDELLALQLPSPSREPLQQ